MFFAFNTSQAKGSTAAPLLAWPREKVVTTLRNFLISATAKDCGVMVGLECHMECQ